MLFIACTLLLLSLIGLILFFNHFHTKTLVLGAMCLVGGFVFYLFAIIEDRDTQIASLRSKLYRANKALEQQDKQSWLEPSNLLQLSKFNDINSFM